MDIWENLVALKSDAPPIVGKLPSAAEFAHEKGFENIEWGGDRAFLAKALERDPYPLPKTEHREGYYGDNHLAYWLSGLELYGLVKDAATKYGVAPGTYLDFGCATGRVVRHFACQSDFRLSMGCDINRQHVDWVMSFLDPEIVAFQNHSLPHIPLPDNSVDLVTAFSVFTHIETWDIAWLLELKRILVPGGMAWITFHSEHTWQEVRPGWPLWNWISQHPDFGKMRGMSLPHPFYVFRHKADRSYTSNVFISTDYLKEKWGRVLKLVDIRRRTPSFQDVAIFIKPH